MRFVALGDSYTIGNAVEPEERWPNQLVARLAREAAALGEEAPLELAANLGVSDYTTRHVIEHELPLLTAARPEVCSILIGTNDVYQRVGGDEYVRNLGTILDAIEAQVGRGRTFGVTSADIAITPHGPEYGDPGVRSRQLRERNALFAGVLLGRGIPVADVYDLSLAVPQDASLVARDGLHPSGRQYALWLDRIVPVVRRMLGG
jgi:lysophospholipase L1-like esterase